MTRPCGITGPDGLMDAGTWRRWLWLLGSIALVCVVAARDIRVGEFDYNVDEARHAVTGLFVAGRVSLVLGTIGGFGPASSVREETEPGLREGPL